LIASLTTTAATLAAVVVSGHGAAWLALRLVTAARAFTRAAPGAPPSLRDGRFFTGTPAVGALFLTTAGGLGGHFCTASVVDSPEKDLVITAAHCVTGVAPGQLAFVPGYRDGREPYGAWQVTGVFVDRAWADRRDPDHDVAFLVVRQPGSAAPVQALTGGERLGTGPGTTSLVRVIGYPRAQQRPLTCQGPARPFGDRQQEFDCAGYTDGTSGGPFLAHFDPGTGEGTVIGVIGGYEQGGDTPAVSYSARFGPAVQALYETAVAGS
jgi:V8-like Glu-specific endopeptidase